MNLSRMNQARELKAKMDKMQHDLGNTIVEANSGGGAVRVTVDGQQKIKSIEISPKVIDPEKKEALEGMVLKAVAEALVKSQRAAAKQLKGLTGHLKIPGLF
jgi:DNA-binding YbaB/EbfC family protein